MFIHQQSPVKKTFIMFIHQKSPVKYMYIVHLYHGYKTTKSGKIHKAFEIGNQPSTRHGNITRHLKRTSLMMMEVQDGLMNMQHG